MIADHLTDIDQFDADFWKMADDLRANSHLGEGERKILTRCGPRGLSSICLLAAIAAIEAAVVGTPLTTAGSEIPHTLSL